MPDTMLNEDVRNQVKELFQNLSGPVEVLFFGSDHPELCGYCSETHQLLKEVISLSEKLSLKVYDIQHDSELAQKYHVDAAPGFVMAALEETGLVDYGVRYKGIPAGHEFVSLVNDLVFVSRRDSGLRPETRSFLQSLSKPVHLQVFVTPT